MECHRVPDARSMPSPASRGKVRMGVNESPGVPCYRPRMLPLSSTSRERGVPGRPGMVTMEPEMG